MYIEQDQVPVVEGFGMYVEQDPVPVIEGFGAATPPAWYMKPDAVTTFLKALQANLGVPQSGVWDLATHNMLWNWVMAREAMTSPGGVSDMPSVLPWKQQVCDADGFPVSASQTARAQTKDEPVTGCMETMSVILEAGLDNYAEDNLALIQALGWPSEAAMREDTIWQGYKDAFAASLAAHIRAQLATPVAPAPCPEGQWRSADGTCVPLVTVTPIVPKPWYKSTGMMAAGAGTVVLAGVVIAMAVSRRRG